MFGVYWSLRKKYNTPANINSSYYLQNSPKISLLEIYSTGVCEKFNELPSNMS